MVKWPDTLVYTPIENINKGNKYQEADGLTAADMNAIVENIDYLYNNSGGSGGGGAATGSKMYNHLLVVKFTTENKTRSVNIMTSSSAKYTLDTLTEYLNVNQKNTQIFGISQFADGTGVTPISLQYWGTGVIRVRTGNLTDKDTLATIVNDSVHEA